MAQAYTPDTQKAALVPSPLGGRERRGHGLVATRRDGTSIWYSIAVPDLFALLDVARAIFEKQLTEQTRMLERQDQDTAQAG